MDTRRKYFRVWKPEENIDLFCKIIDEIHRINDLNPKIIKIGRNTWKRITN